MEFIFGVEFCEKSIQLPILCSCETQRNSEKYIPIINYYIQSGPTGVNCYISINCYIAVYIYKHIAVYCYIAVYGYEFYVYWSFTKLSTCSHLMYTYKERTRIYLCFHRRKTKSIVAIFSCVYVYVDVYMYDIDEYRYKAEYCYIAKSSF